MKPTNEEMMEQRKADLEVMDVLIDGLREELSNISHGCIEAQRVLNKWGFQYELLKKEIKDETNK